MPAITFHKQDTSFAPGHKKQIRDWVKAVASQYGFTIGEIAFVFCSDDHLIGVNRQYLSHDDYTDIITFDYSEDNSISGDILISIDRVRENARMRDLTLEQELGRVMIHGVLHLLGFKDKTPGDKKKMTEAEDRALVVWDGFFAG